MIGDVRASLVAFLQDMRAWSEVHESFGCKPPETFDLWIALVQRRLYSGTLKHTSIDAVVEEVSRARLKFPGNRFLLAALTEEVGELAQAILQKKPRDQIDKEAVQVACLAVRILEEGDSAFDDLTDSEAKL